MRFQLPALRHLLLVACALVGLTQATPFAYISNVNSNSVSVIDLTTHAVTTTVAVEANPKALGLFVGSPAPVAPTAHAAIPSLQDWALLLAWPCGPRGALALPGQADTPARASGAPNCARRATYAPMAREEQSNQHGLLCACPPIAPPSTRPQARRYTAAPFGQQDSPACA